MADQYVWSGAVTPTSFRVVAKLAGDPARVRLAVSESKAFEHAIFAEAGADRNHRIVRFAVDGLKPDRIYTYAIEADGRLDERLRGRVRTFPQGPASFTIAFASCARTGSEHEVFATILRHNPLFFLHLGDLHYLDIDKNDPELFRNAYAAVHASKTQSELYRNIPIAYIWDDHDYGPDNSDGDSPSREASCLTYRECVPHYPLPAGGGAKAVYQAFTAGRVRFILTDLRSEGAAPSETAMSPSQLKWFEGELKRSRDQRQLIVWASTFGWIGETGGWSEFAKQRKGIADFIKKESIENLVVLCGDAHMLAIDDGTHSGYAGSGGTRFPVMQAAALDQTGSVKGGPYTQGPLPGGGQFGLMTVQDKGGNSIRVTWSGRNAADEELMAAEFEVKLR